MNDVATHRLTGSLCSTSHKRPMVWDGHLCRGANLTPPNVDNFCLWTLCGRHDVPANAAEEASVDDVTCVSCAAIFDGEPGTAFRGSAMSDERLKTADIQYLHTLAKDQHDLGNEALSGALGSAADALEAARTRNTALEPMQKALDDLLNQVIHWGDDSQLEAIAAEIKAAESALRLAEGEKE